MAATLLNRPPTLNFDLGETADMLRASVEAFASDEIAPRAAEIDRSNDFPMDLWPKMGELGVLGVTVSPEFTGVVLICASGAMPSAALGGRRPRARHSGPV